MNLPPELSQNQYPSFHDEASFGHPHTHPYPPHPANADYHWRPASFSQLTPVHFSQLFVGAGLQV